MRFGLCFPSVKVTDGRDISSLRFFFDRNKCVTSRCSYLKMVPVVNNNNKMKLGKGSVCAGGCSASLGVRRIGFKLQSAPSVAV